MTEEPSYPPGSFCWAGLATSHPAEARSFYTSLFAWETDERSAGAAGTYTLLQRDRRDVASLYRQTVAGRAAPPHWTSYVSVENVDAAAARALELGGALVRDPFDLVDAARVAALRDPVGAIFSLWQPRLSKGAGVVDQAGALCWHELVTRDGDTARRFYAALLGWTYEASADGYTRVRIGHKLVAGMRVAEGESDTPFWIPYFGVDSVDNIPFTVTALGGEPLTPPAQTPIGHVAVLADPQGAVFGVLLVGRSERESVPFGVLEHRP